jgi:hypothetical protein
MRCAEPDLIISALLSSVVATCIVVCYSDCICSAQDGRYKLVVRAEVERTQVLGSTHVPLRLGQLAAECLWVCGWGWVDGRCVQV